MGSTFASSAANLYMSRFEQQYILNLTVNPFLRHILKFYHFIDNIFCIYTDPLSFDTFSNWLNELHPTIKFTTSGNKQQVNYLDTWVYRTQQNTVAVGPYKKETVKNTYLHYWSLYEKTLRHNILYGQF